MSKTLIILSLLYSAILFAQNNQLFNFDREYGDIGRLYNENKLDSAEYRLKQLENYLLSCDNPFPAKEYSYTIYTLSDIFVRQKKFKESEQILDLAESTLRSHGEQAFAQWKVLLIRKGQIRLMIENVDGAKACFLQAKEFFEKEGDNSSIDYALCLSGLALTYQKSGDYCFSNILLSMSVNIFKNVASSLGVNVINDSRYLTIWNNIALNFQYMGDVESVDKIMTEILNVKDNHSGGNFLALANSAYIEIQKGNYEAAIKLIDSANEYDYGYMYKDYTYQNLILSLYLSDNDIVADVLKHYIDYSKDNLSSILLSYAESERENYWSQNALLLEMLTNAITWKYKTPELQEIAYNNTLYTKSLLTRFSKIVSDFAKENPSSEIRNKYNLLSNLKKNISEKGISTDSVKSIKEKIVILEREVLSYINGPSDIFDDSQISCSKVQQSLRANEVAIEFILLPEFISNNEGVAYYGALIERSNYSHPIIVKLCEQEVIDDILNKHSNELRDGEFVDSLYSLYNAELYNLIIHPLEKYLHDAKTIYFSPVSSIHKINLQAIATSDCQRLMDKYILVEVSSTAKIIENAGRRAEPLSRAFLVGGVDYNESVEYMTLESLKYSRISSSSDLATRSNSRGAWEPIPETLDEVQQIDSIFNICKVNSILLCGGKANEESFKNLDGKSPEILHFATHGFFYKEKGESSTHFFDNMNSYTAKRIPMQYSGILLAGANNAWIGNELPTNVEDGILTAEEISQLDLSGTDIAVLSACDTGLGEIDDIDGVYGLQRGFKMAGVETIIMSLWKVSDDATKILMVEFYKNLMSGKSKHQSLRDAQKHLREVDNGKYEKPEFWASFIMLDGLN